MANRYINAATSLTTTNSTDLYIVPNGCSALVQSVIVSNDSASSANVTATFTDTSTATTYTLLYQAAIPTASSGNILDRPLALEQGDKISLTAGTANAFDVTASILLVDDTSPVPVGQITTASIADNSVTTAKLSGVDLAYMVKMYSEVFG